MSTTARTTQRSGKSQKIDSQTNVTPKTQKQEVKIESVKSLPTAEQMRIAQITATKNEDPALKLKIKQVMDATRKSEDEVCTALHDCDNDANRAVNYLLEGDTRQSEWLTSGKKKKNRTTSVSKADGVVNNHVGSGGEGEDWDAPQTGEVSAGPTRGRGGGQDRERPRQRGGGPPRMRGRGSLENRGWRGRENKENERNLEDGYSSHRRERSGRMSNGPLGGGRGGRGDRIGPRTFQNRGAKTNSGQKFPSTIETWNNPGADENTDKATGFPSPEDWDNEEYTGSLADTKVFTPSTAPEPNSEEDHLESNSAVTSTPAHVDSLAQEPTPTLEQLSTQLSSSPVGVGVNSLTPAQSQYLSQFTQSSENYKSTINSASSSQTYAPVPQQPTVTQASYPTAFTPTSVTCTSNFGANTNVYTPSHQELSSPQLPSQTIPSRSKTQRPRVPPPSKIPSTAVEMPPEDAVNSSIVFLDVQFGGLEFGSGETAVENSVESATPTPVPTPAPVPPPAVSTPVSVMDAYATSTPQQTSIATALSQTQKLSSGDSIMQSEPVVSNSYSTGSINVSNSTRTGSVASGTTNSLSELSTVNAKTPDVSLTYGTVSEPTSIYQTSSTAYQKTSAPVYQTPVSTYNSSSYSTSQVTSSTSVYNSSQVGYASGGGYTTSNSGTTQSANSYPSTNAYSNNQQTTGTSYPYATYPSGTSGGYQSTVPAAYPPQSVYGATYPYQNSYNSSNPPAPSQQNHKISGNLSSNPTKDSQYETVPASSTMTVPASIAPVSSTSVTPSLGLAGSNQTAVSTKVPTISTMSNKSGVVQSIPPGVPPMLGTQYIMSQGGGLPYYQQPVFSYEDLQLLQQRMPPHMAAAGYFDLGFQPQTTLATGRDGLASVAYSMPDARFTRADNNTSPVPSTLSQQSATQAAQHQPMMNPALPQAAAYGGSLYFYGGSLFPGNFQYAPQLYAPVAPTATASGHSNSSSGQYAKGPGTYSSGGYGSGYETGGAADYAAVKVGTGGTGYTGSPAQTKAGTGVGAPAGSNPSTGTDLSANMYNKSHGTLSKVNSYEKQAFHSGTPPPFNMAGSQNSGMAPATGYPQLFISALAPQQHHSAIMHQSMHQDGGAGSGPRSQASTQQNKSGAKQTYNSPSYWNPN